MGIVWEASHKGVPLLGVPGITLDVMSEGIWRRRDPSEVMRKKKAWWMMVNLVFKVFGFGMNFLCGLVIRSLDVPLVGR